MFQFPGLSRRAYVFSTPYRRITDVGFPHSGIRGSLAIQRLTAAYRSRSRPSSTLGAKASTVCPYYLDGDLLGRALRLCPVIPVTLATVQFSRSAKRRSATLVGMGPRSSSHRHRAGLSKL